MIRFALITIALTGCSMRNLVTPAATISGAAAGSVVGPGGAALGAGVGYASGRIYELVGENEDLVEAITHGDVEGIVHAKMKEHATGFENFTSTVKRILIVAACILGVYLAIPIFVARRCSKSEVQKGLTNPPFPIK